MAWSVNPCRGYVCPAVPICAECLFAASSGQNRHRCPRFQDRRGALAGGQELMPRGFFVFSGWLAATELHYHNGSQWSPPHLSISKNTVGSWENTTPMDLVNPSHAVRGRTMQVGNKKGSLGHLDAPLSRAFCVTVSRLMLQLWGHDVGSVK